MNRKNKDTFKEILKASTSLTDFETKIKKSEELEALKLSKAFLWGVYDSAKGRPRALGGLTKEFYPEPEIVAIYDEGISLGKKLSEGRKGFDDFEL